MFIIELTYWWRASTKHQFIQYKIMKRKNKQQWSTISFITFVLATRLLFNDNIYPKQILFLYS